MPLPRDTDVTIDVKKFHILRKEAGFVNVTLFIEAFEPFGPGSGFEGDGILSDPRYDKIVELFKKYKDIETDDEFEHVFDSVGEKECVHVGANTIRQMKGGREGKSYPQYKVMRQRTVECLAAMLKLDNADPLIVDSGKYRVDGNFEYRSSLAKGEKVPSAEIDLLVVEFRASAPSFSDLDKEAFERGLEAFQKAAPNLVIDRIAKFNIFAGTSDGRMVLQSPSPIEAFIWDLRKNSFKNIEDHVSAEKLLALSICFDVLPSDLVKADTLEFKVLKEIEERVMIKSKKCGFFSTIFDRFRKK